MFLICGPSDRKASLWHENWNTRSQFRPGSRKADLRIELFLCVTELDRSASIYHSQRQG